MTEKQKDALSKIIAAVPDDYQAIFKEVADYAISLGYMPTLKGAKKDYADFIKSKVKRTIMKIDTAPTLPRLAIKFYALPEYAGIFKDAIDERVAIWQKLGYEAKCFGCGKCDGTHGFTVTFDDGKQGFLCGGGVFDLPSFGAENVSEVKAALKAQDVFFMANITST